MLPIKRCILLIKRLKIQVLKKPTSSHVEGFQPFKRRNQHIDGSTPQTKTFT